MAKYIDVAARILINKHLSKIGAWHVNLLALNCNL